MEQKEFCVLANVSYSYFNGTLNTDPKANPTLKVIEGMAKALQVSIAELLSEDLIDNHNEFNYFASGYINVEDKKIFDEIKITKVNNEN